MSEIRSTRLSAGVALALIVGFWLLRVAASNCSGPGCEWYIPLSLLLPLLALTAVVVTGVRAISAARSADSRAWIWLLAAATLVSFAGPIASLLVWRDKPGVFVPVASALVILLPVAALAFSVSGAAGTQDQVRR